MYELSECALPGVGRLTLDPPWNETSVMTPQSDIARGARGLPGLALNALLPPRCLGCGTVVARTAALCAGCWKGVQFLDPPLCALCGFPLEYDLGPEALCGACAREPPVFDRARAVMRYHET